MTIRMYDDAMSLVAHWENVPIPDVFSGCALIPGHVQQCVQEWVLIDVKFHKEEH